MNPNNALIGDMTGVELPQVPVDETAINELKKKAKYKRSKEYAELRAKAQARIEFYQHFLPSGQPIFAASFEEKEGAWTLANIIIAEFEQLFGEHEQADALLRKSSVSKYYHPDTDYIRKLGATPPSAQAHGTEEDVANNLKPLKPHSWTLEGNKLIGQTDQGRLVQFIPTNYICKGSDDKGLPILEKIDI